MKTIGFACLSLFCIIAFTCCNNPGTKTSTTADTTTATQTNSNNDISANWRIGVQMWTFRMFTFAEALDKADSAGVKNIEAFWGQPLGAGMKDSFGIRMSAESRSKVKQLLQTKGINMVAMGVISPGTREEWQKAFDLAKEFDLSYITAEPRKDLWNMVDSMAGSAGIKVAIHDHPRPNPYWSPDSVLAALNGHPNLGACADVGHWARSGVNPVDGLKKLEGRVYGVHLKDIKAFNDTKAEDTVVAKGVIDFPAIFNELKRQNFKGMLSIEHESNWYNNMPDVRETVQYYNSQVAKLK
jgi:sugar phosphate isomerase/epimerase